MIGTATFSSTKNAPHAVKSLLAINKQLYNLEHLHSTIQFVTSEQRHSGEYIAILKNRNRIYEQAKNKNPGRGSGEIRNWKPVASVYLNPEKQEQGPVEKKAA